MAVTANDVKLLREQTGAGILECKKVLEETNGDMNASIKLLRERGIVKAEKKQSRIAAEGVCSLVVKENKAVLFELNSETDFVAKNQKFLDLIELIKKLVIKNFPSNTEEALNCIHCNRTLKSIIDDHTALIGEKISLRRVTPIKKVKGQIFGPYIHMGGRIAVVTVLSGNDEEVAKNISLQVAAMDPKFLNPNTVDENYKKNELEIIREFSIRENASSEKPKPLSVLENVILGRLNKQISSQSLSEQEYVKDPSIKVKDYLKKFNMEVLSFVRLAVGEGIEKRNDDFAAEVAKAAKI